MQHEVDKPPAAFPVLQQQQYPKDGAPQSSGAGVAAPVPCVRPSTSGSSGGSPQGVQRGNPPPQQQTRLPPNARTTTNSTQPVQSSPLQQSQTQARPRTASASQQQNPAAAVLPQLARSGTQNSSHTVPPQTPTQSKATLVIAATTPSGGALPALPPSPPLTRSATRSRSSVITATQNHQYVDYLLANGGLPRPISITFSPQRDPHEIDYIFAKGGEIPEVSYVPINSGHDEVGGHGRESLTVFAPLHDSLDAYTQILANGGSVAVGTGYRSVARRLLERVEALFARDIGLPWGETLEWLRGKRRRERLPVLPVLPVRGFLKKDTSGVDEGETPTVLGNNQGGDEPTRYQPPPPPAVPLLQPPADGQGVHQMLQEGEKIRTKTKVEEWLDETETVLSTTINANGGGPVTNSIPTIPNGKANDLAGNFYITLANQFNAPQQNAGALVISQDAASTTSQEEEEEKLVSGVVMDLLNDDHEQKERYTHYLNDNALLERTMLALRRLYPSFPAHTITRSIAALYLLLHPDLHPVLEAISRITKGELDLLNSGRFDGFLDEKDVIPADEEKELEALEVLDGNIFRTMEKLEDEIEALHVRAEEVRRKLRVRKEAIARKMVLAGKDKDAGVAVSGCMDQFGGALTRQNTAATKALVKHVQLPPPPPKSDYFEGLDKESTLNPIMPDDSASNYGSRHRRRTTRKATSSALAGEEGELARRGSTGSGAGRAGLAGGAGSAAQHLMKKQLEREKEKRDKERNREKFEKERERREKEERKKAKLENAVANTYHHRAGGAEGSGPLLHPPYNPLPEMSEKGLLSGSPLAPKKKKSKEEHKEKRDRHRSPERPTTSGKKGLEKPPSREFDMTGGGTTMVATSPPSLLEDAIAPTSSGKERTSKDKDSKKKDKSKEDKEKDKSRKEIDDEQLLPADEQKEPQDSKQRRFSLIKFPKFRSSDHENDDTPRPGTSGSLRPTTAQSAATGFSNATYNTTGTGIGPTDIPPSSGKHRKERRHQSHHKAIPEADDEDDDGGEKIMRQHHTTRRRSSRRPGNSGGGNLTAVPNPVLEVLSEPEDMFGREGRPNHNITGVFSEDEGAGGGGFGGASGIKQQLMTRKSLRRSSESKKVADTENVPSKEKESFSRDKDREKDREKDRKTREQREERRERKRIEREEEEEKLREQERLRASLGMSHSTLAGAPIFSLPHSGPPSAVGSHQGDILPSSVALPSQTPRMSIAEDPRPQTATSDTNHDRERKSRKGKEKEKEKERKPEYKPSFSSSAGEASGQGGDRGGGGGDVDAEVMTLGEGTTMVGDGVMEEGGRSTPVVGRLTVPTGPGDRLSADFFDGGVD
ncbi:hypothetical protein EV426DRAFT_288785 [Tirmania nivea]|nr:hypothetical protein EV426DRAFT_288785 [Tirmania nivea]